MPSGQDIKAGRAYVELYGNKAPIREDLAQTKAEVERWQAEVNRITANAKKAAQAGDLRSAGRQSMLIPGAKQQLDQAQRAYAERAATAQQEAAARAALSKRLASYKAITAEARAQREAMPIGQLTAANKQIRQQAAGAKATTSQFEKLGTAALKVGIAVEATKAAVATVGIVTAAMKGDWEGVEKLVARLPFGLGEIASIAAEVTDQLTGVADEMERINRAASAADKYRTGMEKLQAIGDAARQSVADLAGDTESRLAEARDAKLRAIRKAEGSKRMRQYAEDAVRAEYEARKKAPLTKLLAGLEQQAASAGMTEAEKAIFDLTNLNAGADALERAAAALKKIAAGEQADKLRKAIEAANAQVSVVGKGPIEAALAAFKGANPAQIDNLRKALEALQKAEAKAAAADQVGSLMRRISLATGKMTDIDAGVADFKTANPGASDMQLDILRKTMERANLAEWSKGKVDELGETKDFAEQTAELKAKLRQAVGAEVMSKAQANAVWAKHFVAGSSLRGTTAGSAAAIQSLQAGPALDPLVKASQKTAENTGKLVDQGGPLYT